MEEHISEATPVLREEEKIFSDNLLVTERDKSLGPVITHLNDFIPID